MKVMQSFDICWETSAMFRIHLDMAFCETRLGSQRLRYYDSSIYRLCQEIRPNIDEGNIYNQVLVIPKRHLPLDSRLDGKWFHVEMNH